MNIHFIQTITLDRTLLAGYANGMGWRRKAAEMDCNGRMVCTERDRLREWFKQPLGKRLAAREREELDKVLVNLFGFHLLQVGCLLNEDMTSASRILHRVVVDGDPHETATLVAMYGVPDALPVESDSIDVVVLHHTLEFELNPHEVLREVERILVPEGHVVILGFNPWSWWGLRRFLRRRSGPPWCGRFRSAWRMRDWLSLLGFDHELSRWYFFRPPVQSEGIMRRLEVLERAGERWWPFWGGAFLVVGKKRVSTVTPIKPRWHPNGSLIDPRLVKPSTSSSSTRSPSARHQEQK